MDAGEHLAPASPIGPAAVADWKAREVARYSIRLMLPLAGFWAILLYNLSGYWSSIPQYSYGWLVPGLVIVLLRCRWKHRPPQEQPRNPGAVLSLMAVSALLVLPTWVLEQPNSDWRLVSWLLVIETLILTFGVIELEFGRRTLLYLAPPFLFFLTCVPWPFGIEWPVVQGLTRFVVSLSIDLLNLIGVGAIQHGNLIEVGNGTLDVTEACSGIRSLQSSFMVSIFLGELYRLTPLKRLALIGAGIATALLCNITRACFLVCLAARSGLETTSHWHDSAGVTIMLICFVCVWIIGALLSQNAPEPPAREVFLPRPQLSWRLPIALLLWFLISLGATEGWYRCHEARPLLTWDIQWPRQSAGFEESPISPIAAEMLHFDYGSSARWQDGDGTSRAAYFIKWNPGVSRSRIPSRSHRPEICLAANGYTLRSDLGTAMLNTGTIGIPFEHYLFEYDGLPANVFFCVWQDHPASDTAKVDRYWSRYAGLLFALHGQRVIGQRVFEYVMFGRFTPDEALARFRAEVAPLVVKS